MGFIGLMGYMGDGGFCCHGMATYITRKGTETTDTKKGNRNRFPYKRWAATYFSTNKCSIISEGGLNFSVRNGKR